MKLDASSFINRLGPNPDARHVEHVNAAVTISNNALEAIARVNSDARLSAQGRAEKVKATVAEWLQNGHLRQIADSNAKDVAAIENKRATFVLPALAPDDVRGEIQRGEVRGWLRSLPEAERINIALNSDDPTIKLAIAHATPALSGLKPENHARVVNNMIEQLHGPAIAELAAVEGPVREVEAAVAVAVGLIERE
jgi:hypothetical protein